MISPFFYINEMEKFLMFTLSWLQYKMLENIYK